jgi:FtsH-binding integral membrane protein
MLDFSQVRGKNRAVVAQQDQGLRAYMQYIYRFMAGALALSGLIAFVLGTNEGFMSMLYQVSPQGRASMSPLAMVLMFAPLGFVFALSYGMTSMRFETCRILFWAYAASVGASLSTIFMVYTGESIARVFFITALLFGGMSIYGHTTKRDLSQWGSLLSMAFWGILLAMLVNLFMQSSAADYLISVAVVVISTAMVAFHTQSLRDMYYQLGAASIDEGRKAALYGALSLYVSFLNIFIHLLRLIGDRRD